MQTVIPRELEIKEATPELVEREGQNDVIELIISETDRQTAHEYDDINRCLLCTALRNRGYNAYVGPLDVFLGKEHWRFEEEMTPDVLYRDVEALEPPFYGPQVVGKVIRMRKVT